MIPVSKCCLLVRTGESLGMQLPVTLLYDYQSVSEIVEYIDSRIMAAPSADGAGDGDADEAEADSGRRYMQQAARPEAPSKLLKTLRCALLGMPHSEGFGQ